jgi:hypothetical protein
MMKRAWKWIAGIIGLFILLGILFPESEASRQERADRAAARAAERDSIEAAEEAAALASSQPPGLNARVHLDGMTLRLTNGDTVDWTGCDVEINPGVVRSGWSQRVPAVAAGEVVEGGLMAFTRGDGERFDPSTYAVQEVMVSCDTPQGRARYLGSF